MRRIKAVQEPLVGFELRVLALLLHAWSKPKVARRRRAEWSRKLPAFRRAVGARLGSGGKEVWPWEMVADEYRVVLEAVSQIKKRDFPRRNPEARWVWLRGQKTRHSVTPADAKNVDFVRPFPSPIRGRGWDFTKSARCLAREIVASRLRVSPSKVRDAVGREKQQARRPGMKVKPALRHLAVTLLDLCAAESGSNRPTALQALVLDTLYGDGYRLLALYYLLQMGHTLTYPTAVAPHDPTEVEKLCAAVGSGAGSGPFSELVEG